MQILVLAKEPLTGRVKTRLCPPLSFEEAAAIAAASLADTLDASIAAGADEVVLILDGQPGWWCPAGVRVVAQVDAPFGDRLEAAWTHATGPAIQIGMDTPQANVSVLQAAMTALEQTDPTGGVIGPATDGGWWLLGLHQALAGAFDGVPMSDVRTAKFQVARIAELGVLLSEIETLTDVDTVDQLLVVAGQTHPHSRFHQAFRLLGRTMPDGA